MSNESSQITGKKIGANLIVMVNGIKYSRKVTKEESDEILALIEKYNKKASPVAEKKIIKLMTPKAAETKAVKAKAEAKTKGVKKAAKKEAKKVTKAKKAKVDLLAEIKSKIEAGGLSEEETKQIQELLNKGKKVEEAAPAPVVSSTRRSGEH